MSACPLSAALPKHFALRSKHDKTYLRSVHDESHGGSLVELGGDSDGDVDGAGVMNPRCRFYLEPSKEQEGLIHVRCCYNNKYWVPQHRVLPGHGGTARWVIGTADEPEEDLSKPSCTLLKHIPIADEQAEEEDGSTCRFLHPKLGKYACTVSSTYMHIASDEDEADRPDGLIDTFTMIDVSDKKQLPSYLVFKGDNGQFLQGVFAYTSNWLQYQNPESGDLKVLHSTFTRNYDGVVRIRSEYFGKYWVLDHKKPGGHWVWAESTDSTYNDRNTLFTVVTGDGFIALRNLGNNKFCRRLDATGLTNDLSASAESIITEARVQCHEPVISREIYNVDFRLNEARMYTEDIDGLDSQVVENSTSMTDKTTLTFEWKDTKETTWSSTVSAKLEVKTTLKCGIPFVAEGEIDISTEFSGSYTWGKTETEEKLTKKEIEVEVPPMKKVTVSAIGSNGVCDIPFSYTQRDVLINGKEVIQKFTDGMYVGVKTSKITFKTKEEELSDAS